MGGVGVGGGGGRGMGRSCWHCCSKRLCKLHLSGLRERRRNVGQELKRSVV